MRIVIVALGTRGDVQPVLALGQALQGAGHDVAILAGENFAAWVSASGLEFIPSINIEAVMQSEKGVAWAESSSNGFKQLQMIKALLLEHGDKMAQAIVGASTQADLLVSGFTSEPFVQAASEKYGIRQITTLLQPYRRTKSGIASLLPAFKKRHTVLNRFLGYITERLIWSVNHETVNKLRTQVLGLPAHTAKSYLRTVDHIPTLNAFSPRVVPHPSDLSAHVHTTGYWFLDEHQNWQPPDELLRFLEGKPPVYIGFGSMSSSNPIQAMQMVAGAARGAGQRAIIASGWSGADRAALPPSENVYWLDKAPHGWLFPRVAGVVHHGGAGTTAAGLRAGVPAFIVPHMADQPYWGRRLHELGVAAQPVPRHKLTPEVLAESIRRIATDSKMKQNAAQLGEAIRRERGIENAVQIIERL